MKRFALRSKGALVVGALAVATGLASCGIPNDDEPRAIPLDAMPSSLSEAPISTSTTLDQTTTLRETIFLVSANPASGTSTERLEPKVVDIPNPADPDDLARALLERLTSTTQDDITTPGLRNAIPSDTRVLDATLRDDGVLDLNLSGNLADIESNLQRLALAQIVFTATGVNGVTAVLVSIDGQPAAVPAEAGAVPAGQPISRQSYPTFLSQVDASTGQTGEG
jgi:spore germination protein GerM